MSNLSKPRKVYNFVLADRELASKGGLSAWNSYTDREGIFGPPGNAVMYVTGRDDKGRDIGKYFKLDQNYYNFTVREGEKDVYGKSQFEFLSNAPMCEGSPNGTYLGEGEDRIQIGVLFKLMNTDKDAKIAVETAKRKVDAESSAMNLDDETLTEIAAHIGCFGEPGDLMRHTVYQWAGRRPLEYFTVLKSGDRAVRAIIRKALQDGIFTKKGEIIMWASTVIGSNEDDAVGKLLREKEILEALQDKVDLKTGIQIKGKPGPKKANAV
jgi:hypothetical protein